MTRHGPPTFAQMMERMWRLPRKGSRAHKRRHRQFILLRNAERKRPNLYRAARKVLPLP